MARMKDKKKAKRVTIPGMKGVEGRVTVTEGEYAVKIAEVTQEDGSAAPYLKWKMEIDGGKFDGASLYYNTSLAPQALWNLRSLLEALEQDIPDEDTDIDPEDFVGLPLMVNVEHDTYEGKKQAKIVDFWAGEAKEEEEAPKGKKKAPVEEPEEEEEEEAPKKKRKRGGDDDEDDAPKGRKSKKSKSVPTEDEIDEMSEEELREVIEEHSLDVDLDDYRTLRKMRAAVLEALEA